MNWEKVTIGCESMVQILNFDFMWTSGSCLFVTLKYHLRTEP